MTTSRPRAKAVPVPRHIQQVYDAAMAYITVPTDGIEEITDNYNALDHACKLAEKIEKKAKRIPIPATARTRRGR